VRLKLTLLGGFQAQLDAGAALVLPTRKTQALLAYLALPLGQAHPREKLASLLWGDMQDAQARGNLRHALSRIRKALPKTTRAGILLDGPSVGLNSSALDVDVARFERLIADGRPAALEQIAGLYRGDLLAGLALAEPPFEEWLMSERERLHELAIQALGRLLAHQQKAGAAEPAVQTSLRLLALDPLQEPVRRAVMRLYARLGRREAALRQYQLCVDTLKRELSTQPDAETHPALPGDPALAGPPTPTVRRCPAPARPRRGRSPISCPPRRACCRTPRRRRTCRPRPRS
jgi:DNA-binding SARP family transcriptional activator